MKNNTTSYTALNSRQQGGQHTKIQSKKMINLTYLNRFISYIFLLSAIYLALSCKTQKANQSQFIGSFYQRAGLYYFEYKIKKNGNVVQINRHAEKGTNKIVGNWKIIHNNTILFRFENMQEDEKEKIYIFNKNCLMTIEDTICLYEKKQ